MSIDFEKTERLHALDSLRAIVMLLGLVLHSSLNYVTFDNSAVWSIQDTQSTNIFFDLLVYFIHSFRMPLFFVIAGFFGALLFYEKSQFELLKNRFSRIVLPFIVFVFLMWPLTNFAWFFTRSITAGSDHSFQNALHAVLNNSFIPSTTMHLWFLYYLIYHSLIACLLGFLLNKTTYLSAKIQWLFEWLMKSALLRPLWFTAITVVILYLENSSWIYATGSFKPAWKPLFFHFTFYFFGWLLYRSKKIMADFTRFDGLLITIATSMVCLKILYWQPLSDIETMTYNALTAWLLIFGFMGLFIRFFSQHSAKMRMMSDASYWFYLIHFPLTAFFPGLLITSSLSVWFKFTFVLGSTIIICWLTYYYLVRFSIIGKFLNGKKYLYKT